MVPSYTLRGVLCGLIFCAFISLAVSAPRPQSSVSDPREDNAGDDEIAEQTPRTTLDNSMAKLDIDANLLSRLGVIFGKEKGPDEEQSKGRRGEKGRGKGKKKGDASAGPREEKEGRSKGSSPHPWKKFKERRKDKPKSSEEGADSSEESNEDDSSEEDDGKKRRGPPPRRFHPKWARQGGVTFEEEGGDNSNKTRGFSFKDLFRTLNKFRRGMGQGRGKGWQERGHKGGGPRDEMGQSRSPGPQERGPGGGGGPRDERGPGPQERGPRGGGWGGRHRNRWPMRGRDEGREQDGRDKSQGYNFMDMFWRG